MARTGKIARLPAMIREQLNRRLMDGEAAKPLLEWLNGLEDVQDAMKQGFNGAAINEQNLTEWRQGGYREFELRQEACEFLEDLNEEAGDFSTATDEQPVGELLAARVAVELARVSRALLAEASDPKERWRILRELLPHLAQLRRADQRAARLEMQKERHEWKEAQLETDPAMRWYFKAKDWEELGIWPDEEPGIKPNQTKSG